MIVELRLNKDQKPERSIKQSSKVVRQAHYNINT